MKFFKPGFTSYILFFVIILAVGFVFNPFHNTQEELNQTLKQYQKATPTVSFQKEEIVVQNVIDGDTVTDSRGLKIRLLGINAPEKNQPNFTLARQTLESLVLHKKLDLVLDIEKFDQYGRVLGYLYDGNVFINSELLKKGVAVLETIPPNVAHADELESSQGLGRKNCAGMWKDLCNSSACIQISSIHSDTKGKLNNQYIEFKNTCTASQNLSGYLLKDSSAGNSYLFKNVIVKSSETLRLYSGCGQDLANSLFWQCPERTSGIWNKKGDHAYLYDNTGKLISDLSY